MAAAGARWIASGGAPGLAAMCCGTAQKNAVAAAPVADAAGLVRGVGGGRPPLERTVIPVGSKVTVTLPSRSVRNTRARRASTRASVAGDG